MKIEQVNAYSLLNRMGPVITLRVSGLLFFSFFFFVFFLPFYINYGIFYAESEDPYLMSRSVVSDLSLH